MILVWSKWYTTS